MISAAVRDEALRSERYNPSPRSLQTEKSLKATRNLEIKETMVIKAGSESNEYVSFTMQGGALYAAMHHSNLLITVYKNSLQV